MGSDLRSLFADRVIKVVTRLVPSFTKPRALARRHLRLSYAPRQNRFTHQRDTSYEQSAFAIGVIGAGIGALHLAATPSSPRLRLSRWPGWTTTVCGGWRRVQCAAHLPRVRGSAGGTGYRRGQHLPAERADAPVSIAALQAGNYCWSRSRWRARRTRAARCWRRRSEYGRMLMVSFDKRYRGDVQWIKQYIDSGAVGKIYYAKRTGCAALRHPRLGSWFVSKEQAGGGPLIDLGVHVLDIAMYLMGEPEPVAVSANTYAGSAPAA